MEATVFNKPLKVDNGTVLLHITNQCYNRCRWCYLKKQVGPRKSHLPLEIIKSRLQWIADHVDCDTILLIGGEPLLHPDLCEIMELIITSGKRLEIITSGKISNLKHEKDNYQQVLNYYLADLIRIELSYQPGMNDEAYSRMVQDIKERYQLRREVKKANGVYNPENSDLATTVVLTESCTKSFEEFMSFITHCMQKMMGQDPNLGDMDTYRHYYQRFTSHFAPFDISQSTSMSIKTTDTEDFSPKLNFVGETIVEENGHGYTSIVKPKGGVCHAMKVKKDGDTLIIPEITIRADGDVCFATPSCLTVVRGLVNTDLHQGSQLVYNTALASLRKIKHDNIIRFKRLVAMSAAEYCMADKEYQPDTDTPKCDSCRFDFTCNECHFSTDRW